MRKFDLAVLTAANEQQANGYHQQLEWRQSQGLLSTETRFLVIPDPQGKRIGSGASTIHVLYELLHQSKDDFERAFRNKRILILHSGGDSRRLPAYSAVGKIFIPLPSKKYYALFDAIIDHLEKIPVLNEGQVVIASGDVLLSFDPLLLSFHDSGLTGVAYPDDPEVARHHGVYKGNMDEQEKPCQVIDFLQKPALQELEQIQALDLAGRAYVDTGIFNFALDAVSSLLQLDKVEAKILSGNIHLDLYREIVFAILGKSGVPDLPALKFPFHVSLLPYCGFFHIGKSVEFLHNLYTHTQASALCDFTYYKGSSISAAQQLKNVYVYNSILANEAVSIQAPVIMEGCHILDNLELAGNNILTGLPATAGDIKLKNGLCLSVLPLKGKKWVSILYGLYDDFKSSVDDASCTYLNFPLGQWLKDNKLEEKDLWQTGIKKELWTARFFPTGHDVSQIVKISQELANGSVKTWKNAPRTSMQDILLKANQEDIIKISTNLDRQDRLLNIDRELAADERLSSQKVVEWCKTHDEYTMLMERLRAIFENTQNVLYKARIKKLESLLCVKFVKDEVKSDEIEDQALFMVQQAVQNSLVQGMNDNIPTIQIRSDEVVWACAPARLDFAGGWSDTPPYCFENGGCVLNAAVKLNDQYPIQAIGKIFPKPAIRINSIDLGESRIISDTREMLSLSNPSDWLSLPKAAFVAAGVFPHNLSPDLTKVIERYGAGIDLTLFSALPSGSGLGTSSILGSAIIACLARLFGMMYTRNELFQRTLYMEQLMTTGGGWQDQIGGVVGGVKLIQTQPGLLQEPGIAWTSLTTPDMEISDRFLLYYTGYRRMAKNILKQIVGRYLARDRNTMDTISQLKYQAIEMKKCLDQRDVDNFGNRIATVWQLNKKLDEGSSNVHIEKIISKIEKHICGAKLLGAGGGGFLFIVTKGRQDSLRIKELLTLHPPNERARFFNFDFDQNGLKVSVL
jgi:fucokinase